MIVMQKISSAPSKASSQSDGLGHDVLDLPLYEAKYPIISSVSSDASSVNSLSDVIIFKGAAAKDVPDIVCIFAEESAAIFIFLIIMTCLSEPMYKDSTHLRFCQYTPFCVISTVCRESSLRRYCYSLLPQLTPLRQLSSSRPSDKADKPPHMRRLICDLRYTFNIYVSGANGAHFFAAVGCGPFIPNKDGIRFCVSYMALY